MTSLPQAVLGDRHKRPLDLNPTEIATSSDKVRGIHVLVFLGAIFLTNYEPIVLGYPEHIWQSLRLASYDLPDPPPPVPQNTAGYAQDCPSHGRIHDSASATREAHCTDVSRLHHWPLGRGVPVPLNLTPESRIIERFDGMPCLSPMEEPAPLPAAVSRPLSDKVNPAQNGEEYPA